MATREIGRGVGFNLSSEEGADIERFDQNYKLLQTAIKSSQTSQNYYGDTAKVGAGSGGVQRTVLVLDRGDNLAQARKASVNAETRIAGMNAQPFGGVNEIPFRFFEGSINLKGDEAKKMLQAVVEKFGGQVSKVLGDEVFYTYALDEDIVNKFKAQKKSPSKMFEAKAFKEAQQASLSYEIEQVQKEEQETLALQAKQEEKQRELEDKKQKAYEQKERKAYNLEQQRIQRQIERLEGKTALDGRTYAEIFESSRGENAPVLTRKEELAEYKRIEAEDKKAKEEQSQKEKEAKEAEASRRRTLGTVLKVIGAVTLLANIARRILTAVLDKSVKDRADSINARSLGVTATEARNISNIEKAKGLPEGSFMGFYSDLQTKFGDYRHLDENALAELAPYMPENILPLVRTGQMDLKVLGDMILDKAQALIEQGIDWKGDRVGEEQARRSILNSLNRVSTHAKNITENMVDTNAMGVYAGKAKGVQNYLEAGTNVSTKFTEQELAQYEEIAQLVNGIKGQFQMIKDDIMTGILLDFKNIIGWLSQFNLGKSEGDKMKDAIERRDRVESSLSEMRNIGESLEPFVSSRFEGFDYSKLGKKGVKDFASFIDYAESHPNAFFSELQGSPAFAPLKNILRQEGNLELLGTYLLARKKAKALQKESEKLDITDIEYDPTDYTPTGLSVEVSQDPRLQELRASPTPVQLQQYALAQDKKAYVVATGGRSFKNFGDILKFLREKGVEESEMALRNQEMIQGLEVVSQNLTQKTGRAIGLSRYGIYPSTAKQAVENMKANAKEAGYKINFDEDFSDFESILLSLNPARYSKIIYGTDWSNEGALNAYRGSYLADQRKQSQQSVVQLVEMSKNLEVMGLLREAQRRAEEKGWKNNVYELSATSVKDNKIDVTITVKNEGAKDGIKVGGQVKDTTFGHKEGVNTRMVFQNIGG